MPKKYPPLTPTDVRNILKAAGFQLLRTTASHEQWTHPSLRGKGRHVTVDAHLAEFGKDLLASMIEQSGLTRDEFYCQTQATAKKINRRMRRWI